MSRATRIAQQNADLCAGSTPITDEDDQNDNAPTHPPSNGAPKSKSNRPPKLPSPSNHDALPNHASASSSSANDERASGPGSRSSAKESVSVCDLTQMQTPITPSDDESEIEIIDQVTNTRTRYAASLNAKVHRNPSPEVSINDTHIFEKYTLNGIGGRLYVNQVGKVISVQCTKKMVPYTTNKYILYKRAYIHRGLGYGHSHGHVHVHGHNRDRNGDRNHNRYRSNSNAQSRSHRNKTQSRMQTHSQHSHLNTIQPPKRRKFGLGTNRARSQRQNRSNTADTAIILGDTDSDDEVEQKQDNDSVVGRNGILNRFESLNAPNTNSNMNRKARKRKHHEISSMNLVDGDDDDVVIVNE